MSHSPKEFWALTVWQPWASLIMKGWKPFEFRSWPAPAYLRGYQMAIHAGARQIKRAEIAELIYKLNRGGDIAKSTGLTHHDKVVPWLERVMSGLRLPVSSVLGIVTVGTPVRNTTLRVALGLSEDLSLNDSARHDHSNWGWPVKPVAIAEPHVPVAGKQGLWVWKRSEEVVLTAVEPRKDPVSEAAFTD